MPADRGNLTTLRYPWPWRLIDWLADRLQDTGYWLRYGNLPCRLRERGRDTA